MCRGSVNESFHTVFVITIRVSCLAIILNIKVNVASSNLFQHRSCRHLDSHSQSSTQISIASLKTFHTTMPRFDSLYIQGKVLHSAAALEGQGCQCFLS
jgi:hypothetical protein